MQSRGASGLIKYPSGATLEDNSPLGSEGPRLHVTVLIFTTCSILAVWMDAGGPLRIWNYDFASVVLALKDASLDARNLDAYDVLVNTTVTLFPLEGVTAAVRILIPNKDSSVSLRLDTFTVTPEALYAVTV